MTCFSETRIPEQPVDTRTTALYGGVEPWVAGSILILSSLPYIFLFCRVSCGARGRGEDLVLTK